MDQRNQTIAGESQRIAAIDLLRGAIMIIMALDHVRDYFHADAHYFDPADLSRTTVLLFFTRWFTHFCAPVFVLLAGTSARLSGLRKSKKELSGWLLKRGAWLIFLEITVVCFAWNFNPAFSYISLSVLWALGVGMICLAGAVFVPDRWLLLIALLIIGGHNLFDHIQPTGDSFPDFVWALLHQRRTFMFGGFTVKSSYPLLPWIGVMALGYVLGKLYEPGFEVHKRQIVLFVTGLASLVLFGILRMWDAYGDPSQWGTSPSEGRLLLALINVTKYPPSLDYLLIFIGCALIFLSCAESLRGRVADVIVVYGRVPLFYYIIHLYVIHFAALLLARVTGFGWSMADLHSSATQSPALKGYGLPLTWVYLIWLLVVALMYPACRWYGNYRREHKEKWWLNYL